MSCVGGLKGVINLPYAEIEEPFEAWYNLTGNKSRIQYYGGKQAGIHLLRAAPVPHRSHPCAKEGCRRDHRASVSPSC